MTRSRHGGLCYVPDVSVRVWWALPAPVVAGDEVLVKEFDAAVRSAQGRAAGHLMCRVGCTERCIGLFDITALDAARMARGAAALSRVEPEAGNAIRRRALVQWREVEIDFPGDSGSRLLSENDMQRSEFFARHGDAPCPALDPQSGACLLYAWRPLSCRSFGLPVRCGSQLLPPCHLNFTTAGEEEVAAARVEPDPADREGALLAEAQRAGVAATDTIICAVLAVAVEG
jgi:Fe-S-cluster containining protein